MATRKRQIDYRHQLINRVGTITAKIRLEQHRPDQCTKQRGTQVQKTQQVARPYDHRIGEYGEYRKHADRTERCQIDRDLRQALGSKLHEKLRNRGVELMALHVAFKRIGEHIVDYLE